MKKFFIRQLSTNFTKHDVLTLSAALAFYGALSAAPLLIIIVSVIGALGFEAQHSLLNYAQLTMGSEASKVIEFVIQNAHKNIHLNSTAKVFAVFFLVFSAGGIYVQLQYSMNVIWESKPLETTKQELWNWLKKRLFSILFVFILAIITLVSILASAALSFLFQKTQFLIKFLNFSVTFTVFTLIFYSIFRYLPDEKTERSSCWIGAIVTAILFSSGKDLIGKYLGTSAIASAYGSAGSLLILLMWFYYSSMIVFLGAEICFALQSSRTQLNSDS